MYFIGIDLGTSAVKLLLMDEEGTVWNTVTEEYPICFPKPGWSEQNPSDWFEKTMAGLKKLTQGIDRSQIRAVSYSGQMHGLVALDEEDRVIRPAILWNDGRTGRETDWLNQEIGKEWLSEQTANIAFAGFTAPKILWMQHHEPELFRRIRKIMLPKDYVNYRLTGQFCTDYSDAAGTLLLDVRNRCWSEEMLRLCGISESVLPRLCESFEQTGTLLPEIAAELDFPDTVFAAAGAADNAAAAVGNGIIGTGAEGTGEGTGHSPAAAGGCSLSLGTSGTILIPSSQFCPVPSNALHVFSHADGGWYMMGCMLSAASCWKWWTEQVLHTSDNDTEQAQIESLGHNRVFYLPYLMGERSPHNDPNARAAFIGMDASTTRADMNQAVLEGVLYGLRDSLEIARAQKNAPSFARICGGGAKSPLWKKLAANILGLPVEVPANEEGPAFGAAILAAVAGGAFPSVPAAVEKLCRVKETVLPEEPLVKAYEEGYETFRLLYPALKKVFEK